MTYTPADLETARRHVAEGERHIVKQEMLITRLRMAGSSTDDAEALLDKFHDALRLHRGHYAEIKAMLKAR